MSKWADGRIGRWGPVVFWMALVFILSAQEQLPSPEDRWLDFLVEKSAHTFEYAVLAALLLRALMGDGAWGWRLFWTAVFVAWLYALSDEYHQSFVPGRAADWMDVLFDWLGAVLGACCWLRWRGTD